MIQKQQMKISLLLVGPNFLELEISEKWKEEKLSSLIESNPFSSSYKVCITLIPCSFVLIGFYVAPTPIETAYVDNPLIDQVFVYGDHNLSSIVTIVVPSATLLKDALLEFHLKDLGTEPLPFD